MEWNIFELMWYGLKEILIFAGICTGAFLIVSLLLKQFYKPQSEPEDNIKG